MSYDDSSFDLVLAIEAVSHYLDYDRFWPRRTACSDPVRSSLVVDGNNGLNPADPSTLRAGLGQHERTSETATVRGCSFQSVKK